MGGSSGGVFKLSGPALIEGSRSTYAGYFRAQYLDSSFEGEGPVSRHTRRFLYLRELSF
jgi:hypothetical protein